MQSKSFRLQGGLLVSSVGKIALVLKVGGFLLLQTLRLHGASRMAVSFLLASLRSEVVQLCMARKMVPKRARRIHRTKKRRLGGIHHRGRAPSKPPKPPWTPPGWQPQQQ